MTNVENLAITSTNPSVICSWSCAMLVEPIFEVNSDTPPRFSTTSTRRHTIAPPQSHGSEPSQLHSSAHGAGSEPSNSADSTRLMTYWKPKLTAAVSATATTVLVMVSDRM